MTDPSFLPTQEELVSYLSSQSHPVSKKDLCKHFGIHGREPRQLFKLFLKALVDNNIITKEKGKSFSVPQKDNPVIFTVEIQSFDSDRFVYITKPEKPDSSPHTEIWIKEKYLKKAQPGDLFLIQITEQKKTAVFAKPLKKIERLPDQVVGLVGIRHGGIALIPTNRNMKRQFFVTDEALSAYDFDFQEDDLVVFQPLEDRSIKILDHLGSGLDPKNISLIAIHEHNIPHHFTEDMIAEAEQAKLPPLSNRIDCRHLPLLTIDGEDARDFDDAVYVEPHGEDDWRIFVAIADVAYYVRTDSALDKQALKRGNSVYFSDRVVPMLPEALSNGLCSLNPDEDRACMVAEMIIDHKGNLKQKKVIRGLMRSKARLTYNQVERFITTGQDPAVEPVAKEITALHAVYKILRRAREERGALDIHSTEQKIIFNDNLSIKEVALREQLTSNQIIEELMVLANVAVAELLSEKDFPTVYRVHESPPLDRLETLRNFLAGFGYKLPSSSQIEPKQLNSIIQKSEDRIEKFAVNETVLRAQSQAYYSPENKGHFGLALKHYGHFTSPIRRYADLIVHRALIRLFDLQEENDDDGLMDSQADHLFSIAERISDTERKAAKAERQTTSRLTALFLSDQEDSVFDAQISGVNDFGLFVRLPKFGAEGLIPIRRLPNDYYHLDEVSQSLIGKRTGRIYQFLASLKVRLLEIDPLLDSIVFEPANNKSAVLEEFHIKMPKTRPSKKKRHWKSRKKHKKS